MNALRHLPDVGLDRPGLTGDPRIDLALRWLCESDLFVRNPGSLASGGVKQGYDRRDRIYPFIYSEITGYAISTFVNAYRWTGDARMLDYARLAADYLIRFQDSGDSPARGAFPHGLTFPDFAVRRQYYSFDVAMCAQGLLDLDRVSPSPDLRHSAKQAGAWLIEWMQYEDGAFRAMYDAESGRLEHVGAAFYEDRGCLHAKHAIALLKLAAVFGQRRFEDAALTVCDWVLTLQDADGAFRANERTSEVISHPHCYAVEGLLYAHSVLGLPRHLEAAQRGGRWLLSAQLRDGSIAIAYKRRLRTMGRRAVELIFPRRVSDATAQAARIWLMLYAVEPDPSFLEAARRAATFLSRIQCVRSTDPNAVGGFVQWPGCSMLYAWSAMFAVHALYAVERSMSGGADDGLVAELF